MNLLQRLLRLMHISYILLKYGLDEIVLATHLFRPLRFLIVFSPSRLTGAQKIPAGVRIRKALEECGPIFVKFGQVLSTRADILPEEIIKELSKLQDQVPSFCGKKAKEMVQKALQEPLDSLFLDFEEKPIASASISQVHAATLLNGKKVIVKVLRPHIHQLITRDIELLKTIAKLALKYWKRAKQFKPLSIVEEFEKSLIDELDLIREAANASQLRRNFQHDRSLYIPEIHWPLTKKNILVQERITGIPIYDIDQLKRQGFNLKQLAELGVEIFFTQVFRDCFFHADMHPGNLFVSTEDPKNPQFILVDFGIMGSLQSRDQRYLAQNFLAFLKRDYRRVAELHKESAWIPSYVRIDEFEASIRSVCEPIFEKPLKDISFGTMLLGLIQTASRFHVDIQPQLILLQKTLLNVEGLGRTLYPDLDLWNTAKPFLEKWMKKELGIRSLLKKLKREGPYWLDNLPNLPELLYHLLETSKEHRSFARGTEPSHTMAKQSISKKELGFGILIGIAAFSAYLLIKGYFG